MLGVILYEATELSYFGCKMIYNIVAGTYSYFYSSKEDDNAQELTIEQIQKRLDEMEIEMTTLREIMKNKNK